MALYRTPDEHAEVTCDGGRQFRCADHGAVTCRRCGKPIRRREGETWSHLSNNDTVCSYDGPETHAEPATSCPECGGRGIAYPKGNYWHGFAACQSCPFVFAL